RTRLARGPPSRHSLQCGLGVPGGRTEPFFPLCSRRSVGLILPRNAHAIPSSGFAPCAGSGIIPAPLLPFVRPSPGSCSGNSRVVLFVELHFYNTVVLSPWENSIGHHRLSNSPPRQL